MNETRIYGFRVKYEEKAKLGAYHLKEDLDRKESLVFFDYAKRHGSAEFEDDEERQFTLSYNTDNAFNIFRR